MKLHKLISKLYKSWKNMRLTLKAAVIGGVFTILAAFITIYPQISETIGRSRLPSVIFDKIGISDSIHLYGVLDNEVYNMIPTSCYALAIFDGYELYQNNSVQLSIVFHLKSSEAVTIRDIYINLVSYSSPPIQSLFDSVFINTNELIGGTGGEPVTIITLPSQILSNEYTRIKSTGTEEFFLKEDDAYGFSTGAFLLEPGKYIFNLEVDVSTFDGKEIILKSENHEYNWLFLNDVERLYSGTESLVPCDP